MKDSIKTVKSFTDADRERRMNEALLKRLDAINSTLKTLLYVIFIYAAAFAMMSTIKEFL